MNAGSPALREKIALFSKKHPRCSAALGEGTDPDSLIVFLDGELDASDSHDFQDLALLALAEARERGALVVDLAHLGYVSSLGIGALVNLLAESKRNGPPLYLRNLPEHTRSILELLGFLPLFDLLPKGGPCP